MHSLGPGLLSLAALILATRALAELAQRLGQPSVLGELIAGVILGRSVLGWLDPHEPVVAFLAELGVLVLLFEIGLHTDVRSLRRVGREATIVAFVGVAVPFAGGYAAARLLGFAALEALVAGAALTATSIGISARTLRDAGQLDSHEGQIVLGAAVLDDLLGLVILGVVAALAAGEGIRAGGVARSAGVAIGFVAVAYGVGALVVPPLFARVARLRTAGAIGLVALAFALLLAAAAEWAGSARIIGALAAGLVLHGTPQRHPIEASVTQVGYLLVPIFFAAVGASVDLSALADGRTLLVGAVITAIAVAGKVVTGFTIPQFEGNRWLVGVAMVPRGEVGLIFAQVALASGAIAGGEFGAIMLMVIATTVVAPPWLAAVAKRRGMTGEQAVPEGISDLVAGERHHTPRATMPVKRNYNSE